MISIGSLAQMGPMAAVEALSQVFASFSLATIRQLNRWQYRPLLLAALLIGLCQAAQAQETPRASPSTPPGGAVTLFQNVRIFDGKSGTLSAPSNVLVRGNQIERISTGPIPTDRSATTVLIDGGGRTLMPGLIDMHWHTMLVRPTPAAAAHGGRRLPQPGGRRRGDGHADARVHHRSRPGRAGVRAQARHRRGHRRRPAHLPVRRHHHRHQRSRRLPPAVRSAAHPRRSAVSRGADSEPP